ncbi:MAG: aminoglycoside phosphotransferase family protein [Chloroflexi bacterium]|nr:aminoglycoside phosphotransferase family protein [Chloroflexota bacterium]
MKPPSRKLQASGKVNTAMLDIEQPDALLAYLRANGHIAADEQPLIRTLAGGVSNRTVWVERPSGEAWVLKQALEKLRVSVDWFSSPERVHHEARGLHWLAQLAPPDTITPLVFEDHNQHLLAMQAVPQPHDNWKTLLLAGQLADDHVSQFGRLLGTIHRQAFERRDDIAPMFEDRSIFESLRLEPYYSYTAGQVPAAAGFLHALIAETRACRLTLVHADYSPKNVLVYQGRLILLDHEVIHWGDPAFDLGFSLTHLLSKANHLPSQRSAFATAAQQYWDVYVETVGDHLVHTREWAGLEARSVRHTLACLLARVAGRSPLEYLDEAARFRQKEAVLALLSNPPGRISELVGEFRAQL